MIFQGRPLATVLSPEIIDSCVRRAVNGGNEVVALRKTTSATFAPAHAVIEVLEHLTRSRQGWVPVSVRLAGEYGLDDIVDDIVMGVPAHLGAGGMLSIEELKISDSEHEALLRVREANTRRLVELSA